MGGGAPIRCNECGVKIVFDPRLTLARLPTLLHHTGLRWAQVLGYSEFYHSLLLHRAHSKHYAVSISILFIPHAHC